MINQTKLERAQSSRYFLCLILILVWAFVEPRGAWAQWTTNGTNINNTNTGNVGIGTTGPDRRLDILDATNPQLRLTYTDGAVYCDFQLLSSGQLLLAPTGMDVSSTKPFSVGTDVDAFRFYTYADTTLRWALSTDSSGTFNIAQRGNGWSNQGTRLTLNRSGNLGLGTTAPAFRFDVPAVSGSNYDVAKIGGFQIARAVNDFNNLLMTGGNFNNGTTLTATSTTYSAYQQNDGSHYFYVGSGLTPGSPFTEITAMKITSAGNVGIGTTAPDTRLTVVGPNTSIPTTYNNGEVATFIAPNDSFNAVSIAKGGVTNPQGITFGVNQASLYSEIQSARMGITTNSLILNRQGGNVGVGLAAPAYKLDVAGQIRSTSGGFVFPDGTVQTTAASGGATQWVTSGANIYYNTGSIGVGTTNPTQLFTLNASASANGTTIEFDVGGAAKTYIGAAGTPNSIIIGAASGDTAIRSQGGNILFSTNSGASSQLYLKNGGNVGIGTASPISSLDVQLGANNNYLNLTGPAGSGAWVRVVPQAAGSKVWQAGANNLGYSVYAETDGQYRLMVTNSGDVGIGTTAPQAKLDVQGNVTVTGNISATGNIAAKYQDVAEWVSSSQRLPPGTVVILDPDKTNQVIASTQSYDTRAAGVISDQPGVILGEGGEGKVKVATTGRVRVKVDATLGPIRVGDLLVTSDKPGVAMKSVPINVGGVLIHRPGTIIGKALEPLESGTGEVLTLLSLQ